MTLELRLTDVSGKNSVILVYNNVAVIYLC